MTNKTDLDIQKIVASDLTSYVGHWTGELHKALPVCTYLNPVYKIADPLVTVDTNRVLERSKEANVMVSAHWKTDITTKLWNPVLW